LATFIALSLMKFAVMPSPPEHAKSAEPPPVKL
jgi:hypothetical protein